MTASAYLSVLAAMLALAVGAVYMFGVPPQWKRAMEEKALETMGENKASYLVKSKLCIALCRSFLLLIRLTFQIKSTVSQQQTKRTSTNSSRESEISSEEPYRIHWARKLGTLGIQSLVL